MIRASDGHSAFTDLHDFFISRRADILDWLYEVGRTAGGVALTQAAANVLEKKLGARLAPEARSAMGWIVTVLIDIEEQVRGVEVAAGPRTLSQIAYDDAIATARAAAIQRFTRIGPHAAAQLSMVLGHIDRHHL